MTTGAARLSWCPPPRGSPAVSLPARTAALAGAAMGSGWHGPRADSLGGRSEGAGHRARHVGIGPGETGAAAWSGRASTPACRLRLRAG